MTPFAAWEQNRFFFQTCCNNRITIVVVDFGVILDATRAAHGSLTISFHSTFVYALLSNPLFKGGRRLSHRIPSSKWNIFRGVNFCMSVFVMSLHLRLVPLASGQEIGSFRLNPNRNPPVNTVYSYHQNMSAQCPLLCFHRVPRKKK